MIYTDRELLNFLQEQNDKKRYTGKCVFRQSTTGRGWRLHETCLDGATSDVRKAISEAIEREHCKESKLYEG